MALEVSSTRVVPEVLLVDPVDPVDEPEPVEPEVDPEPEPVDVEPEPVVEPLPELEGGGVVGPPLLLPTAAGLRAATLTPMSVPSDPALWYGLELVSA